MSGAATPLRPRQAPALAHRLGGARDGIATAQRVYAVLLDQILTFQLKPFDEISEGGLAERIGVSRTPVREALARLGRLQLVDIFPQRGTVVAPLRIRDLNRSQFLRESLEFGLLSRALRSTERLRLVEALRAELTVQRTLAAIGDEVRFYASDEHFHRTIAIGAGLPDIWDAIADAKLHMDRFRRLMLASVETLPVVVDQHEAIVDAIARGDRDAAEAAMRAHLRRIFAFIAPARATHPAYFEAGDADANLPVGFDD